MSASWSDTATRTGADTPSASGVPTPLSRETVLSLEGITKAWEKRTILRDVSLSLHQGEIVWLGGVNGAGKTTLLRIAAGLIAPEEGEVRLLGYDPFANSTQFQDHIGVLSAGSLSLYARLTVRQNLEFWSRLTFIPARSRKATIDAAVERFGLTEFADRRCDRISMGQRQRTRVAMTFLHEPTLVLMDEPHTSLDDAGLQYIDVAVEELLAAGGAVMWCSPPIDRDRLPASRRVIIEEGTVRPFSEAGL